MVGGSIKSEPGFAPAFNGKFVGTGNDYISVDADGKRLRLNAHGVIQTEDGASVYLHYTGIVSVSPELTAILSGESESITTPFGDSFTHLTFETGDERYAFLETEVFVAAGHFIYEKAEVTTHKIAASIKVTNTAIAVAKTVNVLTAHPKGRDRSSHRSFGPRAHIESFPSGERMGIEALLGTQVEDYGKCDVLGNITS
ncbi:hypothetical protein LOZ39_002461 [Ophidiomyces ophidiicola]|uniref:Uncharacterized protein n=1 Tax=Ophidiomyces ophidiicola TaxID=1387563 RepID=A0ACB8UZ86_9EURO|nr:hypothetical protein LOZ50_004665 [Ophidiomyces ophidiicola]KAI2020368.1 hypothetical protein LOZ45_005168 [Ophidiomyces ophidiicola]KAI2036675.1 hypothetical protein LOZ47_004141 [Ophidiomyces ophidiicola]KAI2077008.1 hypothetical protein LOZ39_002461 [Ophidiomyces ophidiicola]KAI2114244.1 hypothetical protein LOZ42_003830 [Ophidiomyces ophidiicola]